MRSSRPALLRGGGGVGASGMAGCGVLPFTGGRLSLELLNFVEERRYMHVKMLRADARERSEALVLDEEFELPASDPGDGASPVREENVVDSEKYRVRAHLRGSPWISDDYVFYPDCSDRSDVPEELHIAIVDKGPEPYIEFDQNGCS